MSKVQVVPTKKAIEAGHPNQLINMFPGKETGFIKLQAESLDLSNPMWPRKQVRVSTMKGNKEVLQMVIDTAKANKGLDGRLQIIEVLATEIPDDLRGLFFNDTLSEDENIEQYAKRAGSGEEAPILTLGEVPILRFTKYDPTGLDKDATLAHDNVAEVQEYRSQQVGVVTLPGENKE